MTIQKELTSERRPTIAELSYIVFQIRLIEVCLQRFEGIQQLTRSAAMVSKRIAMKKTKSTIGSDGSVVKVRKIKDGNYPKRPNNPWIKFSSSERERVARENPGSRNEMVTKLLGKIWRGMSEQERKPYGDLYREERKVFEEKKAEYGKLREAELAKEQKTR